MKYYDAQQYSWYNIIVRLCFRGPKKSAVRRMRGGKKKKQRKDSSVEKRYQRNVHDKKTRIDGKPIKIYFDTN